MQDVTVSGSNSSEATNAYSPSVPISLYREVTAELQTSQATLKSLKTQNQQLVQQNQQLRRELDNLTQAAIQLQQAINTAQKVNHTGLPQQNQTPHPKIPNLSQYTTPNPSLSSIELPLTQAVTRNSPPENTESHYTHLEPNSPAVTPPENQPFQPEIPEKLFTEEPEGRLRSVSESQRAELNGFWLVVSIALIVLVAFGAGYWVVRPLLQQQQR